MNQSLRICRLLLAFVWLLAPMAHAESTASFDLAKQFKTEWTSVHYQKSASVNNPDIQKNQRPPTEKNESLSLSCQIHILKPEKILGICSAPTISEISPSTITLKRTATRSRIRERYQPLRYNRTFQHPEPPSKIRQAMRSLLHLPNPVPQRPELLTVLEPSRLELDLDVDVLGSSVARIDQIRGTFHVLVAESIQEIEIPFEPNENWIHLTDDVEIHVQEAQSTGSSYRYRIESRHPNGNRQGARSDISVHSLLPEHILFDRLFIGQNGEPIHRHGPHSLPMHVGGSGSGSGGGSGRGGGSDPVVKIRYRIGVNPQHREVPFTLKRIPLPKP